MTTEHLSPDARAELRGHLFRVFGDGFSEDDWNRALGGFHVIARDASLIGHAAVVERPITIGGHQLRAGYVEGVSTAPERQGEGIGQTLMRRVRQVLHEHFEVGVLSTNAHSFYERCGWQRWQGPSYVCHGEELFRTEEDDEGIMVLCYGASAHVEPNLRICCTARPGNHW